MDNKTYKALGKVLDMATAFAREHGNDPKMHQAIDMVWYWKDEVAKDYEGADATETQ